MDRDIEGDFRVSLSYFSGFLLVEAALASRGTWLRCRVEHSELVNGSSCDQPIRTRRSFSFLRVSVLPQSITVAFSGITLS